MAKKTASTKASVKTASKASGSKTMKVPPPGLDYCPVLGESADLSFGIIRADAPEGTPQRTAKAAVFRRLFPVMRPENIEGPWPQPTCYRQDVQLPPGASDELWDAQRVAEAYDAQGFSLRDLVVILTLRFPEVELVPQQMTLQEAWQLVRGFVWERIVREHQVAAISVMHVPARAAKPGAPHVHVLVPARQLLPSGFGKFARPVLTEDGRELLEKAWIAWRERDA